MIKHVVFFKFRPEVPEGKILQLEKDLAGLPAVIPEIKEFQIGRDVIHSDRSFDLALISAFTDLDALQRYQVHPNHQAVVALVKEIAEKVAAVDFEYS